MEKKKNSGWKSAIFYILTLILVVIVIYVVVAKSNESKKVSYTEFQTMVEKGEVAQVDVYNYTVRIRKIKGVDAKKFPKQVDAYCTITVGDDVYEFIQNYNKRNAVLGTDGEFTFDADGNIVMKEGKR